MTDEERQQVQNVINARLKLLNEKSSRQEAEIKRLSSQLEEKDKEISGLKSQLTEAQEQRKKLVAMIQQNQKLEPEPVKKPEPKPKKTVNYLVSLMRQHFGYDSFRPGQEDVINAILSSRDVFCSMPDNYGKGLCYKLPALLMPGLTLVITPSTPDPKLADSQLHSACILPDLTPTRKRSLMRDIKNGTYKLVYASLKQLNDPEIQNLLKGTEISMAVLKLSWGQPDNLKDSKDYIASLSPRRIPTVIIANATSPLLRQDAMRSLRAPLRTIMGFSRPNVTYRVLRAERKLSALNELLEQKRELPGVIYCSNPESAYKLRESLKDIPGLDEKVLIMPRVLYREITRDDIRFVIHYELPDNLASYYQETNCAGSNGSSAECILLVSRKDFRTADKSVIKFCEDRNPGNALMLYLGLEDKNESPESVTENPPERIIPDEFADFDFGTANEAQKEAITASSGPVLIIAGPGTGKTYTLVQRTVFLIQKRRVKPESIMLATFTNKAATELAARITQELASRRLTADVSMMYIGTFHEICGKLLKDYSEFTRLKRNFRVLDEFDHAYMIMQNLNRFTDLKGADSALKSTGKWKMSCELRDCITTLSEELADPEELAKDSDIAISFLGQAMKEHDAILAENNAMSYSSMLVETYRLLRDNPEILADIQDRISCIMVDEYQDTNYVQEQLVFLIAGERKNICVVGDDDQSLYRFRGAEVRNILEFPDKFGKNECRVVRLMLNYRSLDGIVRFFTGWMNDTGDFFSWGNFRHDKQLEAYRKSTRPSVIRIAGLNDPEDWHEKIVSFIKGLKDSNRITDYNQIAFLFWSVKAPSVSALSQYLENHNINVYSTRSNTFFQRGEIQFAIGCLISMFPKYLNALNSGAFKFNGSEPDYIIYYRECLKNVAKYIDRPAYYDLKKWLLEKRSYHSKLNGYTNYTYTDLIYQLFAFLPFNHALDEDINSGVKATRPARNLARLIDIIRRYERSYNVNNLHSKYLATQFQLMMNIFLRFQIEEGVDEYDTSTGEVRIPSGHVAFLTIHQAKGMEFPIVFADSLWSYPRDNLHQDVNSAMSRKIQQKYYKRPEFEPEDRIKFFDFWRLFYVAFSRAQDLLVLTCNEDKKTPSKYFETEYNKLDDADKDFDMSQLEISPLNDSGLQNIYSFTKHILVYETCPMQYKFFRELEFDPGISNTTFMGIVVHATIEDIHKAAEKHEEAKITEENITRWFEANYETLSRSNQAYLTQSARETALGQVLRYAARQGSDWSAIRRAEAEVNLVRDGYILEGIVDLICMRDNEVEIIDFKSGPKPNININRDRERLETYRRQVTAYAYLVEHTTGLIVNSMKLYYTGEKGNSPEITYTYDQAEAEEIIRGFDETVSRIIQKDFNHRASDIEVCRECGFRYYCERD